MLRWKLLISVRIFFFFSFFFLPLCVHPFPTQLLWKPKQPLAGLWWQRRWEGRMPAAEAGVFHCEVLSCLCRKGHAQVDTNSFLPWFITQFPSFIACLLEHLVPWRTPKSGENLHCSADSTSIFALTAIKLWFWWGWFFLVAYCFFLKEKNTFIFKHSRVLPGYHLGTYSLGSPVKFLPLRASSTVKMYLLIRSFISCVNGSKSFCLAPDRLKFPSLLFSTQSSRSSVTVIFRNSTISFSLGMRLCFRSS